MSCKEYFNEVANDWDSMREEFFPDSVRVTALARAGVIPGRIAADLGAGSGFITEALLKMELQVVAIDQSQTMLNVMRKKFRSYNGQVAYRKGSADALPLPDNHVDYAFANMYLHHVDNPELALQEMVRIVKPGGKVIITDLDSHNHQFLLDEHHDRWMGFEREAIAEWFKSAGLQSISIGNVGSDCCATSECGCDTAAISIFLAIGKKPMP